MKNKLLHRKSNEKCIDFSMQTLVTHTHNQHFKKKKKEKQKQLQIY